MTSVTATDLTATLSMNGAAVTEEIAECFCVRVTVKLLPLSLLGKITSHWVVLAVQWAESASILLWLLAKKKLHGGRD